MLNLNNEIKIKIENPDEIISKLRDKCAVLIGGVKEVTTRYDFEEETLEKSGKFVRTRTGFKNIISIKEKLKDENDTIFTRNDIEVEVSNIKNMQYILKELGLKKTYIMEKYRLKWQYDNIVINIDELFFGCYMEIHGSQEEIWKVFDELELNKEDVVIGTYWDIYENYKKEKGIKEKDIKFPHGYSYKIAR